MRAVKSRDTSAERAVRALLRPIAPGYRLHRTDLPGKPVEKIIYATVESREISEIEQLLPDDLYTIIAENELLMVMDKDAQKAKAVKEVAEHFGISLSEVAAFGDDYNDVEMLRDCGTGVAVANAIEEAKTAAGIICGFNDEDGPARWLEENVL